MQPFSRLFVLASSRDAENGFYATHDDARMSIETRECSTYATVPVRRIGPLAIAYMPRIPDHFIWTWMSDLLVDERVSRAFRADNISGYILKDLADDRSGAQALSRRFWELAVTGFAGFPRADRMYIRERCDECGIYSFAYVGPFAELLDVEKWDGTDIFRLWPFAAQICTDRVAESIRRNGLTGIALIPIEEYETINAHAAPGLPSAWLSPAAADRLRSDPDYISTLRSLS